MNCYLIDPAARTITRHAYTYKSLRTFFPSGVFCSACRLPNDDVIYVDDEGMLHPLLPSFRFKSQGGANTQPLIGPGVVTGVDTDHGTADPRSTIAALERDIEWLTEDQALDWFKSRVDEAFSSITTFSPGGVAHTEALGHFCDLLPTMKGDA
jgi:hypothetical protein